MVRRVEVRSVGHYRIWLRYKDGPGADVDTFCLAGKGAFAASDKKGVHAEARLEQHGVIGWTCDIDLSRDTLCIRLTDKQPEEIFAGPDQPCAIVDRLDARRLLAPPRLQNAAADHNADGDW